MSQENVELVRRSFEAFNRRDIASMLALCDPDIEYFSHLVELEGGGPFRGHDGIQSWWERLLAVSPDFRAEIEEVRDLGAVTVTRQRAHGHGREATSLWSRPNGTSPSGATGWRSGGAFSSARPRPSKPRGCGSRRCRRRTWRS